MRAFVLAAILISILACKDDEPIIPVTDCIGEVETSFGVIPCGENSGASDDYLCEIISFGTFALTEESKAYMPQYCIDAGGQISFENVSGQQIIFDVIRKRYHTSNSTHNTFRPCESDSTKHIGYCVDNERLAITLESTDPPLELTISMRTIPDINTTEIGNIGDMLEISRRTGDNSFVLEFSAVVSQRTLSYAAAYNQEFLDVVEIVGQSFQDVFRNDITNHVGDPFQYYYNEEYGLLAFTDSEGVTWRLN